MQLNKVKVICIGSALVDTIASSPRQIDWGDDVPGYITSNVGGVAFNICQQLALSQLKEVELLTALGKDAKGRNCLLYTSPSPRDVEESRMPSSA